MNTEKTLTKALEYLEAGYSIIPVGRDKTPLLASWREYQTKRATVSDVIAWVEKWPMMNIGIVTGAISGLAIVDVEAGGDISRFPKTMMSKTGNGGWHLWYQYAPGTRNKTRIFELTDVRSEGGYYIAPPSVTDYVTDDGIRKGGSYEMMEETKQYGIQPFPKHIFDAQEKNGAETSKTEWSEVVGGVESGSRNDRAASLCGKMMGAFKPHEWEITVWPLLKAWNSQNTPPLKERELRTVFESIGSKDLKNEREEEEAPVVSLAEAARSMPVIPGVPTGFDVFDECLSGGVRPGDLIVVSGLSGEGKTTFVQTMTYNFVSQKIPCLWLSYEVSLWELWKKFQDMGADERFLGFTPMRIVTGKTDWLEKKIIEAKEKFGCKIVAVDHLGFLSPTPKKGDMNTAQNYSVVLGAICRELKIMALKHDVTIVLIAHTRKSEDPGLQDIGNSAGISQESDAVFMVHRIKNEGESAEIFSPYTKVSLVKNRRTGITKKASCTLVDGKLQLCSNPQEGLNGLPQVKTKPKYTGYSSTAQADFDSW
jgi:hypothetical protein